jgi:branched-chain amino acid transport system ATP-binding protein
VSSSTGSTPGAGPAAPALELRQVRAGYGRIEVLHGVDLAVPAGAVVALFGPNGAGKSTLLKVAGGRLRPTAGTVAVDGQPLDEGPEVLARRGVCSVPEGRGVFPNLSVRDNLRMWTYQGGVDRAEVEARAYAQFPRLGERRRQLAGTLSGGEQQMLAVARVLVRRPPPRLLLVDELSMGLAPLVVAELYERVAALATDGVTVVLVEQFVEVAATVATHAATVVGGRVSALGEPKEVAAAAADAYLAQR